MSPWGGGPFATADGGKISEITSTAGTMTVTDGSGPTTNVEVANPFPGGNYVVTFNTRHGAVTLTLADIQALGAVTASGDASASASVTLGTAIQNTGSGAILTVYTQITALTTALLSGVGSTSSPTQQTIIGSAPAVTMIVPVAVYVPGGWYALLSITGSGGTVLGAQWTYI